jgi:hypothetical protein
MNLVRNSRFRFSALGTAIAVGAAVASISSPAHATVYKIEFTASNFTGGAPYSSISGSATFEAASLTAPMTAVLGIDLTIGPKTFTLAEVGPFGNGSTLKYAIGGLAAGVTAMAPGTNDFALLWDPGRANPLGTQLTYTVAGMSGAWSSFFFPATISVVPEPSAGLLMLSGLAICGLVGMRRQRQARA